MHVTRHTVVARLQCGHEAFYLLSSSLYEKDEKVLPQKKGDYYY